ncbi:phosphoribosylformylglycinamidine synthase subunit PurQ [Commensalibacter nepenthis]|uniref:Phosphoribosylformylglycinamidine synthase subunit PurQ n=1 Tax=Commensalibacter nepenthis TaxID=3043872 RepID=A0ABT6Q4L8_9PROT|nr:phosphoribosylformylglycinamidine synthase subunit PurQ [Commensalibacter sp. TBRC 10068]MDI2111849.1 phosphoribosylformylglycinamidine synthase subunit PurQ [Commensalibacter sp. TBRC 10068]
MKIGIVVFPGTNRERDMVIAFERVTGFTLQIIWHRETALPQLDMVVLPGGFSYGDYLRCGAMAAHSPIMREIQAFAQKGGYIMGVCNGFQILTEANLLPGALLPNASLRFLSRDCHLRIERNDTAFTKGWRQGDVFRTATAHGDGNYFCDAEGLKRLEGEGQVVFRYTSPTGDIDPLNSDYNPNGSINAIAGIVDQTGRICGMMPHPEDMVDPLMGSEDGKPLFQGIMETLTR